MNQKTLSFLLSLGYCVMVFLVQAQEKISPSYFTRELSFTTENDAYLLQQHDAYYTNGGFIRLSKAGLKKGKKITSSWELGQMIYTPLIRKTIVPSDIDRPYCGYLFGKYSRAQFSQQDALFQYSISLGIVGPGSLGENLQNGYHSLLGYSKFTGWKYQVQDAVGVDLGAVYARTLWQDSSLIKLVPVAQLNLGANFTNASVGAYLCLGSFEKNANSALWNARIQNTATATQRKYEFFAYWYPHIILQGYNATVEGGLFRKGNGGAVLGETERWMFQQNVGLCYAKTRWTAKLEVVFQDREAVAQKTPQQYASIQLSYRLR